MQHVDIAIVGGGLVGSTLAAILKNTHFRVALIEAFAPPTHPQAVQDMRSLALSYAGKLLFEKHQLWEALAPIATPIKKIHVSQEKKFAKTILDAKTLQLDIFGYVIPIPLLYQTLQQHLTNSDRLSLFRPEKLSQITRKENFWELTLENHSIPLQTRLLIAADGDNSFVRELLKLPITRTDYQQTALVSSAKISEPHDNTAYQRFTQEGVLAVMPRENQHAGIIWTTDNLHVENIKQHFLEKTQLSFGYKLGKFSALGSIQTYPLKHLHVEKQTLPGLILLGNAAHVLHHIAAQGFNLGLRDISTLLNLLAQYPDLENPLLYQTYEKQCKLYQQSNEAFVHKLLKIFGTKNPFLSAVRGVGLFAFDLLPAAKRAFCLRRMGLSVK